MTMTSKVFEFLDEIRRRPQMYIGFDPTERGKQLLALGSMLMGYEHALELHGISEPVGYFHAAFTKYLRDRFTWSMSCGPIAAIQMNSTDDAQAWDRFWVLVDDFRKSVEG